MNQLCLGFMKPLHQSEHAFYSRNFLKNFPSASGLFSFILQHIPVEGKNFAFLLFKLVFECHCFFNIHTHSSSGPDPFHIFSCWSKLSHQLISCLVMLFSYHPISRVEKLIFFQVITISVKVFFSLKLTWSCVISSKYINSSQYNWS